MAAAPTPPKATFHPPPEPPPPLDADPLLAALLQSDWRARTESAGSTLLDTEFKAVRCNAVLRAWQQSTARPRMLHYVALLPHYTHATDWGGLQQVLGAAAIDALDAGVHRVVLSELQVSLTLCVGEPLQMLGALRLRANHILAASERSHWDRWWLKALARCCRPGTQLHFEDAQGLPPNAMLEAGWVWATHANLTSPADSANPSSHTNPKLPVGPNTSTDATNHTGPPDHYNGLDLPAHRLALFAPRWRNARQQPLPAALPIGRCAVVGAGLAGAAVARALAERGWQVAVYDEHTEPAQGASGLPAGLVAPLVSADDGPRSQLLRRGTRLMLAQAEQRLVRGRDWDLTGVLEHHRDRDGEATPATRWHPQAAWIKPASMVRAWLAHPSIRFVPASAVHALQRVGADWQLLDADSRELGRADVVVLANAFGCQAVLRSSDAALPTNTRPLQVDPAVVRALARLQQLHGSVSIGSHSSPGTPGAEDAPPAADPRETMGTALPRIPVNGRGSFIPWVHGADGPRWIAGATYENDASRAADAAQQHHANFDKLVQLVPHCKEALAHAFAESPLDHWHNTRCATWDRLPLVGPVEFGSTPTVWMCAGLGSRGLGLATLCAELLVAQMGAEPWPLEASLARQLHSQRLKT